MFVQNIETLEQQQLFLGLAEQLVHADGIYADEEKERIAYFQRQMPSITALTPSPELLSHAFTTRQARGSALLELIGLAYADGVVADEEFTLLKDIANIFSYSQAELESMIEWVKQTFTLFNEVNTYLEG